MFAFALIGCANENVGTPQQRAQARAQNKSTAAAAGTFAGAVLEEFTGGRRDRYDYRRGRGYGHGYGYGYGAPIPVPVPVPIYGPYFGY